MLRRAGLRLWAAASSQAAESGSLLTKVIPPKVRSMARRKIGDSLGRGEILCRSLQSRLQKRGRGLRNESSRPSPPPGIVAEPVSRCDEASLIASSAHPRAPGLDPAGLSAAPAMERKAMRPLRRRSRCPPHSRDLFWPLAGGRRALTALPPPSAPGYLAPRSRAKPGAAFRRGCATAIGTGRATTGVVWRTATRGAGLQQTQPHRLACRPQVRLMRPKRYRSLGSPDLPGPWGSAVLARRASQPPLPET